MFIFAWPRRATIFQICNACGVSACFQPQWRNVPAWIAFVCDIISRLRVRTIYRVPLLLLLLLLPSLVEFDAGKLDRIDFSKIIVKEEKFGNVPFIRFIKSTSLYYFLKFCYCGKFKKYIYISRQISWLRSREGIKNFEGRRTTVTTLLVFDCDESRDRLREF